MAFFIIGVIGLAAVAGVMLSSGYLASRDRQATVSVGGGVESIVLNINKAHVEIVESDEKQIDLKLNLWADTDIDPLSVAQVKEDGGVLTITETAPQNTFFGVFEQPYELIITIKVPADMTESIEETRE